MADKQVKRIQFEMRINSCAIDLEDGLEVKVLWVRGI